MRGNGGFIDKGTHFLQRLGNAGMLFYPQGVAGNQDAVPAAFVSAHGRFVVGGRSAALPQFFQNQAGNVGFSHICSRADDKQRFIHNQTSSYLNHSAFYQRNQPFS